MTEKIAALRVLNTHLGGACTGNEVKHLKTHSIVDGSLHAFSVGGNWYAVDLVTEEVTWRG